MVTRQQTEADASHEVPTNVKQILAATDFSPHAERAVEWAIMLARKLGATVTALHVVDMSLGAVAGLPTGVAAMPAVAELRERVRAEAAEDMARLEARFSGIETLILDGSPRAKILEAARDLEADVIVMGTHGRTGVARVFFGSVAEHVVRSSTVPVLTVPLSDGGEPQS